MRMHLGLFVAVALPMLLPSAGAGQSLFVSGGGFVNIHEVGRFSSQSPIALDQNLSDTTPAFDVSVGGSLARHVVMQLDLAFPQTIKKTFGPPRNLPPLPPLTFTSQQHVEYQTRHASVLAGYQTSARRHVSAALLGGLMFVQERTHTITTTMPASPGTPLPSENSNSVYRIAPVLGIDVPVSTMAHLAVVPHARIYKLDTSSGTLGIWPGVDVRWTF